MGRHGPAARNRYALGVCTLCIVTGVNIPNTLLGLLEPEPTHGYELKRAYDLRFGNGQPLKFGQVYATLGRLERDGRIEVCGRRARVGARPQALRHHPRRRHRASTSGWASPRRPSPTCSRCCSPRWCSPSCPGGRPTGTSTPSGAAHLARMRELTARRRAGDLGQALLADYALFHLEADLRWIDLTESRLDQLRAEVQS